MPEIFITLPYKLERDPPPFEDNYIKTPESLIRHFLDGYTKPGDRIFDPFAGLGTTLFMAEKMKRIPFGVEAEDSRHQWVAGQMKHWHHLIHGDSARMDRMGFPKMDACITAPPFMAITDKWNPLFAGNPAKSGYETYLKRMKFIFGKLTQVMKRNVPVIVQVDNIPGKTFTPLVRDLGYAISSVMKQDDEIIVAWKGGRADYRHTHCLVFKNTRP